ncbi:MULTISPECIES: DUF6248 family natural product biosynthesis protein [unclassified Streptomyces]|uniref:DUF6248 family natural product biosynthesis protein n=1 Tax=unclassified Streptomyces TaxID=2593676 RepID=UPI00339FA96F
MTPDQAAWVRTYALTRGVLASFGPTLTLCACQYGPSGHCDADRHDQCGHRTHPEWYERRDPDTYLTDQAGNVLAEVHRAGQPCRWRCPCQCHRPEGPAERGLLFDI